MSWLRLIEESINETEPPSKQLRHETTREEPGEVTAKTVSKKHKVQNLVKEMWPAYLVEIFVIILGISITLALEEWRDTTKEKQLERIYHKNLLADIEVDLQSLQYVTSHTNQLLDKGNDLLRFIKTPSAYTIPSNQLNVNIQAILGRPNFISSDATFSDLKNSGNLHLLKDIQLKNLLFAYYSQAQNIKENQDAEQQATITISGSYFLKSFPMGEMGSEQVKSPGELKALAGNIEFANNVLLRVLNRKELLGRYEKANALGIQLKKALAEKVNE